MARTMSVQKLVDKLNSGFYTEEQLRSLKRNYETYTDNNSKEKLQVLNQFLENGSITMTEQKTHSTPDRHTITLNTTHPIISDTSPDLTDTGVAKKYLQVYESATKRGIEFSLTLSDVRSLIKKKKCHYTGLTYDYTDPEKSPSFDRLDSRKGYTKDNVVSCRKDVNSIKNILIEHPVSVFRDNPVLLAKVVDKWIV